MKNMFVAILMALTSSVFAEEIPQNNTNYIATIDLTKVENDRVKVTIDVPEVSGSERSRLKTRRNSLITGMGYLENRGGQTPAIVAEG